MPAPCKLARFRSVSAFSCSFLLAALHALMTLNASEVVSALNACSALLDVWVLAGAALALQLVCGCTFARGL